MANVLTPPRFEDIISDAEMYFASQSARATDFNPGSVIRTIIEIVAQIQERRDVAVWSMLDRAIDEAVFDAWGFPREEAQLATGQVTLFPGVGQTAAFTIQQGALFRVPDDPIHVYEAISYAKNSDGTLGWDTVNSTPTLWYSNPNISASTLNVRALAPGSQANIGAKLVTQAFSPIPGIASIKNLQAFTNGKDASTEADRRAAFTAYVQSLPRGTVTALKYGAKTAKLTDDFGLVTEQVRKVFLVEGTTPATVLTDALESPISLSSGNVALFIHNGSGVASSDLITQCQKVIDGYYDNQGTLQPGWRAAGIPVTVYPAKLQTQNVNVEITVAKGFQLNQIAQLVVLATQNCFNVLDVGETLLYTDLLMFLKLIPGVLDVILVTPTTDTDPPDNALVTLGTITGHATLAGTSTQIAISYPTSA